MEGRRPTEPVEIDYSVSLSSKLNSVITKDYQSANRGTNGIIRTEGGLKLIKNSFGNYQIVDSKRVVKDLNKQDGENLSRNNVIKLKAYL